MSETALIEIRQLPIIAERLYSVKEEIEKAVEEAQTMICTADTVQAVKSRRAELRKQFDALEDQRKAVKNAVLAPYNEFEAVYKECVTEPMKRGDNALKCAIDDFEAELKSRCRETIESYYSELCAVNGIDFITFDQAMTKGGLKIGMADAYAKTPRKLMDSLLSVMEGVAGDVETIDSMNSDQGIAVMAEYQHNGFSLASAIQAVNERAARAKAAQEAAEARKTAQEAQNAAVAKVDAVAPPVALEPPTAPEKRYTITFTIKDVTREQAVRVRDFLKQEGIEYE